MLSQLSVLQSSLIDELIYAVLIIAQPTLNEIASKFYSKFSKKIAKKPFLLKMHGKLQDGRGEGGRGGGGERGGGVGGAGGEHIRTVFL